VSGGDGFQLWLSLAEPVPVAQAMDFLESLRLRYLGDIATRHNGLMPMADVSASGQARHAKLEPALQEDTGRWSAFVAPGLASMFSEEPWLDLTPNFDAQAKLLSGFESIKPADFRQAQNRLQPVGESSPAAASAHGIEHGESGPAQPLTGGASDPRRFLLGVMNDPAVELSLRIEAAKALLPYAGDEGRG